MSTAIDELEKVLARNEQLEDRVHHLLSVLKSLDALLTPTTIEDAKRFIKSQIEAEEQVTI